MPHLAHTWSAQPISGRALAKQQHHSCSMGYYKKHVLVVSNMPLSVTCSVTAVVQLQKHSVRLNLYHTTAVL